MFVYKYIVYNNFIFKTTLIKLVLSNMQFDFNKNKTVFQI